MATKRKTKRYDGEDDSLVTSDDMDQPVAAAASARRSISDYQTQKSDSGDSSGSGTTRTPMQSDSTSGPATSSPAKKAPTVSAKQLQDFKDANGQDKTLRDYLNAQQKLTRRGSADNENTATSGAGRGGQGGATARDLDMAKNAGRGGQGGATARELMMARNAGRGSQGVPSGYAKGGPIRSASSKRADGIATKGFTKGKYC